MDMDKYRDLLSVADLIDIFGVSKQTIYRELHDGAFGEPIRMGRAYKVPKMYVYNKFFRNYL
jgi:predicted DNA-binding transcriptional regulator AlpA